MWRRCQFPAGCANGSTETLSILESQRIVTFVFILNCTLLYWNTIFRIFIVQLHWWYIVTLSFFSRLSLHLLLCKISVECNVKSVEGCNEDGAWLYTSEIMFVKKTFHQFHTSTIVLSDDHLPFKLTRTVINYFLNLWTSCCIKFCPAYLVFAKFSTGFLLILEWKLISWVPGVNHTWNGYHIQKDVLNIPRSESSWNQCRTPLCKFQAPEEADELTCLKNLRHSFYSVYCGRITVVQLTSSFKIHTSYLMNQWIKSVLQLLLLIMVY